MENYNRLVARCNKIARLGQLAGLAGWDQQTYMPPGAAEARGEQLAVISELIHEMTVADETSQLISSAEAEIAGMDSDSDEVRSLRVVRRGHELATKIPGHLVAEASRHQSVAMPLWAQARAESDYSKFAPALEKSIELARQVAEHLGYKDHIYDALIDQYEIGATRADVAKMYADLTPHLVSLTAAIRDAKPNDDSVLMGNFPIDRQQSVTLDIVKSLGYDLNRGRQDIAAHPFCSGFSRDDVRITTRFNSEFLQQALYASLHEAGHAMYEQGIPASLNGLPISNAASLGIHESQSRLWENQVGRSRAFANWAFPTLQAAFPESLGNSNAEAYYKAVNVGRPSYIRVEADDVTYTLHVALRFELECALLSGELSVKDVPSAWNARMEKFLGITPPNDSLGVLQDVHWSIGLIGYFPTYSIGNIVSAQLWNAASREIPDLCRLVETGQFSPLLYWLNTNVHAHGCKFLPSEIVLKATGEPLNPAYYVNYLNTKYGELYGL